MGSKKSRVFYITVSILLAFSLGFATSQIQQNSQEKNSAKEYPLLAKRIQINDPNDIQINFTELRNDLEIYITDLGPDYKDKVSVYFEYLPTGVSININENYELIGASLMKLPVVMTLYRLAGEGKIDLDKKVALKKEWLNNDYGTLYQKGEGYEISLREAARLTLKDSDNTAILMIFNELKGVDDPSKGAVNFLDIKLDVVQDERVEIGARSYSSVLKCLYLACYNSKEDSQEILQYLTESSFNNRLTLYFQDNIKVAHKIGTFSNRYQSDCGIFYLENRNYILCVMVDGPDPEASRIIGTISQKINMHIANINTQD